MRKILDSLIVEIAVLAIVSLDGCIHRSPAAQRVAHSDQVNELQVHQFDLPENCTDSIEKDKKVVEFYEGKPSSEAAKSLYRLSLCYEYLGDDPKATLALLQLHQQIPYLKKEGADVEIPARLAAAYARQGNPEQSRFYYSKAEAGLKKMRNVRGQEDKMKWLPKTLFSMGYLPPFKHPMTPEKFRNSLQSLDQSQIWLMRAAELNAPTWSQKAADNLKTIYNSAWQAIDLFEINDEQDRFQALKLKQDSQKMMAADLDSTLSRLRLERLPYSDEDPEPQLVTDVFDFIDSIQKRLDLLLNESDVQDQPTPDSKARNRLRREGHIKDVKKK